MNVNVKKMERRLPRSSNSFIPTHGHSHAHSHLNGNSIPNNNNNNNNNNNSNIKKLNGIPGPFQQQQQISNNIQSQNQPHHHQQQQQQQNIYGQQQQPRNNINGNNGNNNGSKSNFYWSNSNSRGEGNENSGGGGGGSSGFYGHPNHIPNAHYLNGHTIPLRNYDTVVHQIQQHHLTHQQQQQQTAMQNNNNNSKGHDDEFDMLDGFDNLPSTLVESMRTLFDILDDTKEGKILLSDIESRWDGSNSAEPLLKIGVMGYLRKVTPKDGLLTFERFCSGLRLALLTNNNNIKDNINSAQNNQVQSAKNLPSQSAISNSNNNSNIEQIIHNNNNNQKQSKIGLPILQQNLISRSKIPSLSSSSRLPTPNNSNNNSNNNNINNSNNNIISNNNNIRVTPNNHLVNQNNIHQTLLSSTSSNNIRKKSLQEMSSLQNNFIIGNQLESNFQIGQNNKMGISRYKGHKNGSLDNLKSDSSSAELEKDNRDERPLTRPPSAPLLDLDSSQMTSSSNEMNSNNSTPIKSSVSSGSNSVNANNITKNRTRSKDRTFGLFSNKSSSSSSGVNYKASSPGDDGSNSKENSKKERGRSSISMPQLQLSKLKPKTISISMDEDSKDKEGGKIGKFNKEKSPAAAVKTSAKSLLAPSLVSSAIPTFSKTLPLGPKYSEKINGNNNNNNSRSFIEKNSINSSNHNNNNSIIILEQNLPPPPPKPPRNNNTGPMNNILPALVHNNDNSPPSANSTVSFSSSSNNSGPPPPPPPLSSNQNNNKQPEIKTTLNSWPKGLSLGEKKIAPIEPMAIGQPVLTSTTNSNVINAVLQQQQQQQQQKNSHHLNSSLSTSTPTTNPNITNNNNTSISNKDQLTRNEVVIKPSGNNKSSARKREASRRHTVTVQTCIDFATIKRLKQLEQERDVLQSGISNLENFKDWYTKQMEGVGDKISLLTKGAPTTEYWSETHEERLNILGCKLSEINSLIQALILEDDGSGNRWQLASQMNLQFPSQLKTISRLKEQNRLLTQEVSDTNHRVSQLENEKAMLLRQLFHTQKAQREYTSKHSSGDETVYM